MMQKIFEIYTGEFGEQPCDFVKIYVTWKDIRGSLINLLKIWEAPFAKYPNRPGDYHWKRAATLYRELMVDPVSFPYRTVLECTCLNPGCWPFQVIAEETEDQVLWTKFLQPHRDRNSYANEFWDYSRYPPLVFDKQQYYDELQLMKPTYEEWAKRRAEWNAAHPSMTAKEACDLAKSKILVTLRARFSEIPQEIETTICNISVSFVLDLLESHAETCQSLDEFAEYCDYHLRRLKENLK